MFPFLFFIFQPFATVISSSPSSTPSLLQDQPISLILPYLSRLFIFCRDNTIVAFLFILLLITVLWLFGFSFFISRTSLLQSLRSLGVSALRAKRCVIELRRKSFHLLGLLIPIIYYNGLKYSTWLDQRRASLILGTITLCIFIIEGLRLTLPSFHKLYTSQFSSLMRKAERDAERVHLTGNLFFFAGNFLAIYCFHPTIATCASLFLVLGDLSAAIFGISFGRTRLPSGKSIEGALAMWMTCLMIGTACFWRTTLAESHTQTSHRLYTD